MSGFRIEREYPHPVEAVWLAVTDPQIVPQWTAAGRGARPVGFVPEVGCRFRFVARPLPGWNGVVDCEVLAVERPHLLQFTWQGGDGEVPTVVTYRLAPSGEGTRLTYTHTGFTGVGGRAMALLLGAVRRRMLGTALPAVLHRRDDGERPDAG